MPSDAMSMPPAIALFFILVVVGLLMISGIGVNIFEFLNDLWQSDRDLTHEDQVAYYSINTLKCAIDSVATGQQNSCVSQYNKGKMEGAITGRQGSGLSDLWGNGEGNGNDINTNYDPNEVAPEEKAWVGCSGSGDSISCKVSNFQLQQYFSDYQEWISAAGDPQYLVYFQNFPMGEDSQWSGQSAWFESFGKIMFATFCVAHFIRPVTALWSGAKSVISLKAVQSSSRGAQVLKNLGSKFKGLKGISEYIFHPIRSGRRAVGIAKTAAKATLNRGIVTQYGDDVARFASQNGVSGLKRVEVAKAFTDIRNGKIAETSLASYISTAEATSIITKLIGSKATQAATTAVTNPRFIAYTGIDTITSYYLARANSELGKFTDFYGDSLVLQRTMAANDTRKDFELESHGIAKPDQITDPTKQNIVDLKSPVVIDKPEVLNPSKNFYLASPCYADVEVKIDKAKCGVYSYESDTHSISCDSPSDESWLDGLKYIPECGALPSWGNKEFIKKEQEIVNQMDVEIFPEDSETIDTTNLVCCHNANDDVYEWLTKELCSVDGRRVAASDSACSGVTRPASTLTRKQFFDPIHRMTFYYDESTGIPDFFKRTWDCSGTQSYAEVEYDSDNGPSVWYTYDGGKWKYKIPDLSSQYYHVYHNVIDAPELFSVLGVDTNPHQTLLNQLQTMNFEDGSKLIEDTLNDYDSRGRDDKITIYYPDGSTIETDEVDEEKYRVYELSDLLDLCNSPIQKMPLPVMPKGLTSSPSRSGIDVACRKYKLEEDFSIENLEFFGGSKEMQQGLGEEGAEVFSCHLQRLHIPISSYQLADDEDDMVTDINIYFNVDENGDIGKPFAIKYIKKDLSLIPTIIGQFKEIEIILMDYSGNGKIDELAHYYTDEQSLYATSLFDVTYSVFSDKDSDGTVEMVSSNKCSIDAITLRPDTDPYDEDPNYCYKRSYTTVLGLVETVSLFGVSALTKTAKFGGVKGWALATFVDCTIAYAEYRWGSSQWPG